MTSDPKPDAVTADRPCHEYGYAADVDKAEAWDAICAKSAEITRLRAELAEARESAKSAHAVCFAAGIEAALAAAVDYTPEKHSGLTLASHVTGKNIQNAIRALTPPDITAAAARVLLAAWPTDTSFDAAFAACATAYHGGDQMQDTMDRTLATVSAALRALAEVKP